MEYQHMAGFFLAPSFIFASRNVSCSSKRKIHKARKEEGKKFMAMPDIFLCEDHLSAKQSEKEAK
jgi:hypothetical protein